MPSNTKCVMITVPVFARTEALWNLTLRSLAALPQRGVAVHLIVLNGIPSGRTQAECVAAIEQATGHHRSQSTLFIGENNSPVKHAAYIKPRGVAESWNLALQAGDKLGCTHVVFANQDVFPHAGTIEKLIAAAETDKQSVIFCGSDVSNNTPQPGLDHTSPNAFSLFAVNRWDFATTLGEFDENFDPIYCEDLDIIIRATLRRRSVHEVEGAHFDHTGSATIRLDEDAAERNKDTYAKNLAYLLRKWGTTARHPSVANIPYHTPFNVLRNGVNFWPKGEA